MYEILECLPKMLAGEKLDNALRIMPDYDTEIIHKSMEERLIALHDIFQIFIPNKMSREIYSKLYLSLLHSLKKKQTIMAIRQFSENGKILRKKSYESIIGGSDSFTIIGTSGIGKSSAVSRAIQKIIRRESNVLDLY